MRTNLRNSILIPLLHRALLVVGLASGAETGSVDATLEKFVNAIGGKEAWSKVESRSIKAVYEGPMGATSKWSLWAKAPNKRLTRMESSPWGVLLDGFDGEIAWSKNQNGIQTKEGDELILIRKMADFRREIRLRDLYPDLALKGTEIHDGETVQVLESRPTPGQKERFLFSVKTGLLVCQESRSKNAEGRETLVEIRYSDYRMSEGISYPYVQHIKITGAGQEYDLGMKVLEFKMNVKEIKHNVKIEEAIFHKPPD